MRLGWGWTRALAFVALSPAAAFAADLPPAPRYVFQHVGDEQGLATKTVTCLFFDRTGFLWVGTQDGLYRFDGARFERIGREEGLPAPYVLSVLQAPDGSIWAGTNGGIARVHPERRALRLPSAAGETRATMQGFAFTREGRLLVATTNGVASLDPARPDGAKLLRDASGAMLPAAEAVASDSDGRVLVACAGRVGALDGAGAVRLFPGAALEAEPKTLLVDGAKRLWVRTQRRLFRWDGAAFVDETGALPSSNDFGAPSLDRPGRLLVPTVQGLYLREEKGWRGPVGRAQGATTNATICAAEDPEGGLWVGYGGAGLDRWAGRDAFAAWSRTEGLPDEVVWSVLRARDGTLWVGTSDGLAAWNARAGWRTWGERDGLAGRTVRQMAETDDGAVVTLSVPGGVTRVANGRAETLPPLPDRDRIRFVVRGPDGRCWGTSRSGVWAFSVARRWEKAGVPAGAEGSTAQLEVTPDGTVWGWGRDGLARLCGGAWRRFGTKDGLKADLVEHVVAASADEIWVCYRNLPGVSRLRLTPRGAEVLHVGPRQGLGNANPYFLGLDRAGLLHAGGDSGVSIVSPDGSVRNVNRGDGLLWDDTSADAFFAEEDGSVLLGTSRGLVHLRTAALPSAAGPPPVVLTGVRLGGKDRLAQSGVEVPWAERLFEASFAGLTFRDPGRVRFRYRLAGLESETAETATREVRYAGIPAGSYRFEVWCRSSAGVSSRTPALFVFTVNPPWWATPFVRITLALLVGAAIFGLVRVRLRRLERARSHLEGVVAERTHLLNQRNDELSQAVRRLQDAQRQIVQLSERLPEGLEDLPGWSRRMAHEIGAMLAVGEIGVFSLEDDRVVPLARTRRPPPTAEEIEATHGRPAERQGGAMTLLPIVGPTEKILGAVELPARFAAMGEVERHLLESFVRHLGSTLELRQTRERLLETGEERSRALAELRGKGVATLRECPRCGRCEDEGTESCPKDDAPLVLRILPRRVAGRYRLDRLLGEGGMGGVYAAVDEKLGRDVAVKILRAERIHDVALRARLEREGRIVARIRHPGVVALHDSGELPDGSTFLVMEHLEGFDLADALARWGPGTPVQVARVLTQVAEALAAAHAAGVVHRDLKPANLFLVPSTHAFRCKVLDFGLAKSLTENVKATRTGWVVGSPAYMSPEQVREEPLGASSDLFSLASVAYELLTAEPAFEGPSTADVFEAVMRRDPIPLAGRLAGAGPELDQVFANAFRKDPKARPTSVEAWVATVVPLLERLPSTRRGWPVTVESEPVPTA